jgi:glycosyltransferase involved in cell wall biosynthesis
MRLLHVLASANPAGGGPIEAILRQSEAFRAMGRGEIELVTLDDPSASWVQAYPGKIIALGVPRTELTGWRRRLPWVHYGYAPAFVPWLKKNARGYDAVVLNGIWNYTALGVKSALVGTRIPYVVFPHGMLDPWFVKTYRLKAIFKQISWWFCEGPVLNNARAVFFTTEEERTLARGVFHPYRVRERVVGLGTSDIQGDAARQSEAFRAQMPRLGSRPYLLYLSRIHPKKGCDLLIEAFAAAMPARPGLQLVIAGPDQTGWRQQLEKRAGELGIADSIHWPGMLSGDVKWGAFRGAEAFVLPSHQENFGVVVAEAMAAGRPALITNKVNIWREVEESGGGLVESDDVEGITRLLRQFLSMTEETRAEMGRRARACFLERFEIHSAVTSIDSALREVVA